MTLRVAVTNGGTACHGIFRRQTHYLGCVHSKIFRGGAVRRAESGRAAHFTAVTETSVVPEVDIGGNPHKNGGPGTRAHLRRRRDLSTLGLAKHCNGRLKLGLQRQPRHQNRLEKDATSLAKENMLFGQETIDKHKKLLGPHNFEKKLDMENETQTLAKNTPFKENAKK